MSINPFVQSRTLRAVAGGLAWAVTMPALAVATCSVSTTPMAFSTYDTLSNSASQISATLTMSCVIALAPLAVIPYTISLGTSGTSGTMSRQLAGPLGSRLQYNLYIDSSRSTVWGNGSGGTQTVASSVSPGTLGVAAARSHSIYGAIPPRQAVRPGVYADGILVTVDY